MKVPDQNELFSKARQVLGWPKLLDELSARAFSESAKNRFAELELSTNPQAIRLSLTDAGQMMDLINLGTPIPLAEFDSMHAHIETADMGGVLSIEALESIARLLLVASELSSFFKNKKRSEGRLAARASKLDRCVSLSRELDHCLDLEGGLKDSASTALRSLRAKQRTLHDRVVRRLESMIHSTDLPLQDKFYTQRGSRYVIPIRTDAHHSVKGIVHDSSASGATVFIEPEELVGSNNELRLLEGQIVNEISNILRMLSSMVAESRGPLEINQRVLTDFDELQAKARLACEIDAHVPQIEDSIQVELRSARHPLLALAGQDPVANDVVLGHPVRVMLISGPNTGGKTVYLKMVGLLSLMVRAGIPIPVDPDSKMAVFPEVYADIGDSQDISKDLSTYSGHLLNIVGILNAAGPESLVLLDELISSTDPVEGAALAGSVLAELGQRVAATVATTHFGPLKVFAQKQEGFSNSSFDFDLDNWAPTYHLNLGSPGRSLGLPISAKLGMPESIVAQARGMLDQADLKVDDLLAELESQRRELLEELAQARESRGKLKNMVEEYRERLERLEAKEKELQRTAKSRVKDEVKRARSELNIIMNEMRSAPKRSQQKVQQTRTIIDRLEKETEKRLPEPAARIEGKIPDPASLKQGDIIKVMPFNKEATLITTPGPIKPKDQVRVDMDGMKLTVTADALRLIPGGAKKKPKPKPKPKPPKPIQDDYAPSEVPQTASNTLDLRGMRAHEAEADLEHYLDDAAISHKSTIFIIHGHGTGVLKQLVRELLVDSPYVHSFRAGVLGEGGDGVTVAAINELG